MASGVYTWSKNTDTTNGSIDSSINWSEGQPPSSVNDSARNMMAQIARWRDDNAGSLVTGGTGAAYTLTSNQGFTTLAGMAGQTLRFKIHATSTSTTSTINVDTLGAKNLTWGLNLPLAVGDLVANQTYSAVYDNSNGIWVLQASYSAIPSGTLMLFQQTAAPAGWTKQTTHNDKALRVVSGTASSGGIYAFSGVFADRAITVANLPNYSLSVNVTDPGHVHATSVPVSSALATTGSGSSVWLASTTGDTTSATTGISVAVTSGGSGTAQQFAVEYVDLIIASKN